MRKCEKPPRRHRKFRPAGRLLLCAVRRAAGQHGRNKPFYQDYSFRKEYMSVGNLVQVVKKKCVETHDL